MPTRNWRFCDAAFSVVQCHQALATSFMEMSLNPERHAAFGARWPRSTQCLHIFTWQIMLEYTMFFQPKPMVWPGVSILGSAQLRGLSGLSGLRSLAGPFQSHLDLSAAKRHPNLNIVTKELNFVSCYMGRTTRISKVKSEVIRGIVDYCGLLWIIVDYCGLLWIIVDYCGLLWIIVGIVSAFWIWKVSACSFRPESRLFQPVASGIPSFRGCHFDAASCVWSSAASMSLTPRYSGKSWTQRTTPDTRHFTKRSKSPHTCAAAAASLVSTTWLLKLKRTLYRSLTWSFKEKFDEAAKWQVAWKIWKLYEIIKSLKLTH